MRQSSPPSESIVRFGIFELDLRAGELRKQGVKVKLQEQPFKILQFLLQNPGQVVSREELRSRIWPADTYVEFDQGLYSAIARLRDALGDSSESPRFIETVARLSVCRASDGRKLLGGHASWRSNGSDSTRAHRARSPKADHVRIGRSGRRGVSADDCLCL